MTHTGQSREAFESWAQLHYQGGSLNLDRDGEDYRYHLVSEWWAAWQDAMAHKAADVVLPEPDASVFTMQALVPGGHEVSHVTLHKPLPAGTKLYTEQTVRALLAAAPSVPQGWIELTDEDRDRAFNSLPDMLEGFLKKWGWLHFAKAIEQICREKNSPQPPKEQT